MNIARFFRTDKTSIQDRLIGVLTLVALCFAIFKNGAPIEQVKGVFGFTRLTDKIFFPQILETLFALVFLYFLSLPFIKRKGFFEGMVLGYLTVAAAISVLRRTYQIANLRECWSNQAITKTCSPQEV